ncbi:MAG: hypothetical protein JWP57_3689 [Spirosoma sp.]|nr:hypothetical protein [Spirosoma sp.]
MTVILIKVLIAISGTLAFVVGLRFRNTVMALSEPKANRLLSIAFVLCRLVPFVVVYLLMGLEPHSDVPIFYESASHALRGEVVYRDFWSPYSPLFAYITALPLLVWHSAKSIVLLMIIVEGLAWWFTYRFYRPRQGEVAQLWALLYLLLPGPFVFCILGGQEDVWMWVFGAASLWLWAAGASAFRLGLLMAAMLIVTKALAVLIAIALFFWVRRPVQYVAGLAVVGLPSLVLLYMLTGEGMLTPLMFASMPFAPNLPTVLAPLIGDFTPYAGLLSTAGLIVVVVLSAWGGWQLRLSHVPYERALPILWVLCFGFMMFIHKSSFGNYLFIYALPLMVIIPDWKNTRLIVVLLVLNSLAAVHPSLWWQMGAPIYSDPSRLGQGRYLGEYLMEVGIVASVGYFVWLAYRQIKQTALPVHKGFEPEPVSP